MMKAEPRRGHDQESSLPIKAKEDAAVEAVARAIDPVAWDFIDKHEHDDPPHPAVPITRQHQLKQSQAALAALRKMGWREGE